MLTPNTSENILSASNPSIIIALDWYDERVVQGIYRYAKEHRWHISPYLVADRAIPYGWPGDGAITCYGPETAKYIDSLEMPTVDISYVDMSRPMPRVRVDNQQICKLAAEHFHSRGYRYFAYYSWEAIEVNQLRHDAFKQELLKLGVPENHILTIHQSGLDKMLHWSKHLEDIVDQLEQLPRPLAVFAGQDDLAASLIEMCIRSGIQVPEELSILGVDNRELLCEGSLIPVSSIQTRLNELGYESAKRLDQLMKGEITKHAEPVLVRPQGIVTRQSTDVLAIEHPAVAKAVRFIKKNFSKAITIEHVIEQTGLSKRGIEKAFEKHLGRSPASELRRIRLNEAKRKLTETDTKIDLIAIECGYSNNSNLSCAFRRDTGMSPRAYRLKYANQNTRELQGTCVEEEASAASSE